MARYKYYSYEQGVMIPVNFNTQILLRDFLFPASIEYRFKTEQRVIEYFYEIKRQIIH